MSLHWADLTFIVTAVIAGCAATYLALLRAMRKIFSEREAAIADQLEALGDAVGALETRMDARTGARNATRVRSLGR